MRTTLAFNGLILQAKFRGNPLIEESSLEVLYKKAVSSFENLIIFTALQETGTEYRKRGLSIEREH